MTQSSLRALGEKSLHRMIPVFGKTSAKQVWRPGSGDIPRGMLLHDIAEYETYLKDIYAMILYTHRSTEA